MNRLEAYRLLARRLVEYACDGPLGRDEDDPVYRRVTEDRDMGAMQRKYSSCGDLAHWLLFRLGVRESWLNRREHLGWRSGQNVAALCWRPCPSRPPRIAERFDAGDILVIYSQPDTWDAHVLVVLEHDGDTVLSGDYGQPGGALRTRRLSGDNLGGRDIHHVLDLGQALTGSLDPPDWALLEALPGRHAFTGEELDACAQAIGFPLPNRPDEAA